VMGMDDGLSELADLADLSDLTGCLTLDLVVRLQEMSGTQTRSILVSLSNHIPTAH
jgi:hypothetical protein